MKNPLLDKDFLKQLDEYRSHEVYARITALSVKELPIEQIEGKVTGGSVNIDGASAVRRTCNLSLVAGDVNINDFYWGLHNKFKLEVGLRNEINSEYPDIVWFPQGIYVITSFNTSLSTSGFNISIAGKDKMCLLNGEVGGQLPASIDFGMEEYVDLESKTTTYTKVPIKKIIREALHAYALEPYHNIIINDLEDSGLELLEYRCEDPAYLLYHLDSEEYSQIVFKGDMVCYLDDGKNTQITLEKIPNYNKRVDSLVDDAPTRIRMKIDGDLYTVAKLEYGQTAGYRLTDLVYPGDLITNIGETLTSIFDKIVKMLGNFEYFYDLDGRFIFQEKKTYVQTSWNNITTIEDYWMDNENNIVTDKEYYVDNAVYSTSIAYHFEGNNLISSFSNSPDLNNLRNDYSVWGNRKTVNDVEVPVHYRYAIHKKPKYYKNYEGVEFTDDKWDWREIIYQMALDYYQHGEEDDFCIQVGRNNYDYYPAGITEYEQFYLDIQGFWRQLYNPKPNPEYYNYIYDSNNEEQIFIPLNEREEKIKDLYVHDRYTQLNKDSEIEDRSNVYIVKEFNGKSEFQKLIDTIPVKYDFDDDGNQTVYYITADTDDGYKLITKNVSERIEKKEIYIKVDDDYISILNAYQLNDSCYLKEEVEEYFLVAELPAAARSLYQTVDGTYNKYYTVSKLGLDGQPIKKKDEDGKETNEFEFTKQYLKYYVKYYEYFLENEQYQYWNKQVKEAPDSLNFWMDFLDSSEVFTDILGRSYTIGSELDNYAVSVVGDRTKVINDSDVSSIYFRDVPNLIFTTRQQLEVIDLKEKTGYIFMFLPNSMMDPSGSVEFNYFNISAQGKSAKEKLDELLYYHSYCVESINISAIPIYYLQPNTRILVRDDNSKINGEYIVSRISIPLTYNGMMSITATKAPQRLY